MGIGYGPSLSNGTICPSNGLKPAYAPFAVSSIRSALDGFSQKSLIANTGDHVRKSLLYGICTLARMSALRQYTIAPVPALRQMRSDRPSPSRSLWRADSVADAIALHPSRAIARIESMGRRFMTISSHRIDGMVVWCNLRSVHRPWWRKPAGTPLSPPR